MKKGYLSYTSLSGTIKPVTCHINFPLNLDGDRLTTKFSPL